MNIIKIFSYILLFFLAYLFLNQQIYISHVKKLAQKDLDVIHQSIEKYSSNLNNNQKLQFLKNKDLAYQEAINNIKHMNSSTDHMNIIKNYMIMLEDNLVLFLPTTQASIQDYSDYQNFDFITLPSNIGIIKTPITRCRPCSTEDDKD